MLKVYLDKKIKNVKTFTQITHNADCSIGSVCVLYIQVFVFTILYNIKNDFKNSIVNTMFTITVGVRFQIFNIKYQVIFNFFFFVRNVKNKYSKKNNK